MWPRAANAAIITSPITAAKTGIARSARDRQRVTGWRRADDLLPVEYFHVVFTLPAGIARIAFWHKRAVYGLLFRAAAETVMTIATDPKRLGARVGMTAVLHTWGSALTHHPHIHMIVPGGGLSPDGTRWVACKPGFFLHVRVLSHLFRRLFLDGLMDLHRAGELVFFGDLTGLTDIAAFAAFLTPFRKTEWVVYAKPPFGGPEAVLAYLSRYTHRVAISNHRLVSADAETVAFRWKDYRIKHGERQKVMSLATPEFIRRFLMHVLPGGFHRIRHYGLLASAARKANIAHIRELLGQRPIVQDPQEVAETNPAHPARTMSLLRRPDAHRRDLPSRAKTLIPRTAPGAGCMTKRPSLVNRIPRRAAAIRITPGLPRAVICTQMCGNPRRLYPKPEIPTDPASRRGFPFLTNRGLDLDVVTTRRTLSP